MTLSSGECDILFATGGGKADNTYALAKYLDREQSAVHRSCKSLLKRGFLSSSIIETKGNGWNKKKLQLTLLGFKSVVDILSARVDTAEDEIPHKPVPKTDCTYKIAYADQMSAASRRASEVREFLKQNAHLHESIEIYLKIFDFSEKSYFDEVVMLLDVLSATFRAIDEQIQYNKRLPKAKKWSDEYLGRHLNEMVGEALSKNLFFHMAGHALNPVIQSFTPGIDEYFHNEIIPLFRASGGYNLILEEFKREEEAHLAMCRLRASFTSDSP